MEQRLIIWLIVIAFSSTSTAQDNGPSEEVIKEMLVLQYRDNPPLSFAEQAGWLGDTTNHKIENILILKRAKPQQLPNGTVFWQLVVLVSGTYDTASSYPGILARGFKSKRNRYIGEIELACYRDPYGDWKSRTLNLELKSSETVAEQPSSRTSRDSESRPLAGLNPSPEDVEEHDSREKPKHSYVIFKPLVVNLDAAAPARFFQLEIALLVYGTETPSAIERHMPALRDSLLTLLSTRTFEQLITRKGKEDLRTSILAGVRETLDQENTSSSEIEAVYFIGFVMQ